MARTRKRRRPKDAVAHAPTVPGATSHAQIDARPDWRWRTFPVAAAVVAGLVIGAFTHTADTDFAIAVRVVAVFGAAYVLIHMFVMNVIVAGRIKRRNAAIAGGTTPDEDYEDVVVPPEER
jgi:hypothetical protein